MKNVHLAQYAKAKGITVASLASSTDHIVLKDLDPEFIETALTRLPWEYERIYDELSRDRHLDFDGRMEEYNRRRGLCAVEALIYSCDRHKVPYEYFRLDCNGQRKLLVRMGRLIIIQEPAEFFGGAPKFANYKLQLASTRYSAQQLEFDFKDGFSRNREWSDCVLGVLIHKPAGPNFSKSHKAFGGATLAIPDAGYTHWTRRFDLEEIAMHGRKGAKWLVDDFAEKRDVDQVDEVFVSPKKKNFVREAE